jgi:hypothetical protein
MQNKFEECVPLIKLGWIIFIKYWSKNKCLSYTSKRNWWFKSQSKRFYKENRWAQCFVLWKQKERSKSKVEKADKQRTIWAREIFIQNWNIFAALKGRLSRVNETHKTGLWRPESRTNFIKHLIKVKHRGAKR